MTTNVTRKETALVAGPEFIVASQHIERIVWGLGQVLEHSPTKSFWSAVPVGKKPQSRIMFYPTVVIGPAKIFEKRLSATEAAIQLPQIMSELLGDPLIYIPQSEGHMELGWEILRDYKKNPDNKGDKGLPVAIVSARMCRP